MRVVFRLRWMLTVLAIVGLVVGPFTAPVNAAAIAAASSMSMPDMAADKPCCPGDGQAAVPDCLTTCPLMAMCVGMSLCATLTLVSEAFLIQSDVIRPGRDIMGESLTAEPPPRPPRT
jgi:hypothetical protein